VKRSIMIGKLHGLRVTGADLHYEGSIALDPEHCALAGLLPMEFVEIWNKHTGARISTYIIYGEPGSRCCVLNGAAARTCQKGDELIIAARADVELAELPETRSRVVIFDEHNSVKQVIEHGWKQETSGRWSVLRRALDVPGAPAAKKKG
jgi:aspartate 1-decarboxylase